MRHVALSGSRCKALVLEHLAPEIECPWQAFEDQRGSGVAVSNLHDPLNDAGAYPVLRMSGPLPLWASSRAQKRGAQRRGG
eukprot:676204-Alexandrium_andersonii.AAC.1